jgi:hypothetical protein
MMNRTLLIDTFRENLNKAREQGKLPKVSLSQNKLVERMKEAARKQGKEFKPMPMKNINPLRARLMNKTKEE